MKKSIMVLLSESLSVILSRPLVVIPVFLFQAVVLTVAVAQLNLPELKDILNLLQSLLSILFAFVIFYTLILCDQALRGPGADFKAACDRLVSRFWALAALFLVVAAAVIAWLLGIMAFTFVLSILLNSLLKNNEALFRLIILVPAMTVFVLGLYYCFVFPSLVIIFEDKGVREAIGRNLDIVKANHGLVLPFVAACFILYGAVVAVEWGLSLALDSAVLILIVSTLLTAVYFAYTTVLSFLVYREAAK